MPLPTTYSGPRTVFVHLFEWKWTDIAQECETFLGPKGFSAVQVSPPNEHIRPQDAPDLAWWVRYQPVSYQLESRSGSRAEFIDMVQRCGAVGVGVYVDAVINHMTGGESGVGTAGTRYTHYEYPDLDGTGRYAYGYQDFHHCGRPFDDIGNYGDAWEVQTCELSNLADLDTGSPYVQERIAAYLQDLVDMGVAGFRLDAAKHMAPGDIAAILGRVQGDPYIFQEVIDRGGEGVSSGDYLANGDITEFNVGGKLSEVFLGGQLAGLESFGESWGLLPSASAVAFIDNHDNQRGHGGGGPLLTHRDGGLYNLAEVFMLAWPYGYPRIMSSYAWDGVNDRTGPPSDRQGNTNTIYANGQPDCFGNVPGQDWICEHRWQAIANMVGFHNATSANFYVSDWWSNGAQQIAFGRGDAGFVVINREGFALTGQWLKTSLPGGRYCDIIHGELTADGQNCTGPIITVQADGTFPATVNSMDALALHVDAKLP
jgi:alpha-amylase